MQLPTICICTAAAQIDINLVWEAMGRGSGTFSRKLVADDTPDLDHETTPTHFLMSDAAVDAADVADWQAMTSGNLPPVPDGTVWGENGVISAADAMTACAAANLQIYTAAGDVAPTEHAAGILLGRGLVFVPDPPL